ncbi:hypothetical protein C8R47DRAFT_1325627 [Mycena vitilis]|nr:hypothetical protein C8R47DRAFT_1325627 [Mycena vitilis]
MRLGPNRINIATSIGMKVYERRRQRAGVGACLLDVHKDRENRILASYHHSVPGLRQALRRSTEAIDHLFVLEPGWIWLFENPSSEGIASARPGRHCTLAAVLAHEPLPPSDIFTYGRISAQPDLLCPLHAQGAEVGLCDQSGDAPDLRAGLEAPAVDALKLALLRRFNALGAGTQQPLVSASSRGTPTPAHLVHALRDTHGHKYALVVKLVRDAHHTHETAAHLLPGRAAAAGKDKTLSVTRTRCPLSVDADAVFNARAGLTLDVVAADVQGGRRHELAQRGLAELTPAGTLRVSERAADRVTFGHLCGMLVHRVRIHLWFAR